jgi:hypothetical protein
MSDTPEQIALKNYQSSVDTIVNQGREDYGDATFDEMAGEIASAIGEQNILPFMVSIAETDAPQRVIEHLASNPDRAKKIAAMTPARRSAELGRIEAQLMPNGSGAGDEPAWKARARGGEKRGLGEDLDDKTWERNFKKANPGGWIPPSARR